MTVHIPVIDLTSYLQNPTCPDAKSKTASLFREACENQGFLQVTGHSVTPEIQSDFLSAISRFFDLPVAEKEKVAQAHSPCNRGYERIGAQRLEEVDETASADQKESFSVRRDRELAGGDSGLGFLQGPNQWPEEDAVPGFKEAYTRYYDAVHALSVHVFRLLALSLGLDEEYFDGFAADPDGLCLCRAHHYPPTKPDAAGTTRGVGAHTDFGALTLLLQDEVGGLEVLHKATNTWHHVTPIPGAYVCNIGDLMQRWTNDRYKSTMHRVISPLSGKDRYTCAFFHDGPIETMVECLPTCVATGDVPHYEPIRVGDHMKKRYEQSYGAAGTTLKVKAAA